MAKTTNLNSYNSVPRKGVSWRAIFAGTVTVLSIMLLLNLIGLSIGLGSIEPTEESNPLSGLGTGSLIWWIVSSLIALFAGGYVAARVGVSFSNKSGIIQGIMTWALYTFISTWLITSAIGSIISGVGNVVGNVLTSAGQVVENQLGPVIEEQAQELDISLEDARQEFYALLRDTQKEELQPEELEQRAQEVGSTAQARGERAAQRPGQVDAEVERVFSEARNQFEDSYEALDREALVNVLVERTDMSEQEAQETVDSYIAQYENLRQEAEAFLERSREEINQQAENVADAAADAALYMAIAMILGIIAAAGGGFVGVKNLRDDYEDTHYVHNYEIHDTRDNVNNDNRGGAATGSRRDRNDDFELR